MKGWERHGKTAHSLNMTLKCLYASYLFQFYLHQNILLPDLFADNIFTQIVKEIWQSPFFRYPHRHNIPFTSSTTNCLEDCMHESPAEHDLISQICDVLLSVALSSSQVKMYILHMSRKRLAQLYPEFEPPLVKWCNPAVLGLAWPAHSGTIHTLSTQRQVWQLL